MSELDIPEIKCVLIGDACSGKQHLCISYLEGKLPDAGYVPIAADNYSIKVNAGLKSYNLRLWDTAGQEDYDTLRPLFYSQTDIFLVCFSFANEESFQRIQRKWVPEIKRKNPKVPFLIVGTQIEQRTGASSSGQISSEMCLKLAKKLKAVGYLECSATTREGVENVFQQAVLAATNNIQTSAKNKSKCILQ